MTSLRFALPFLAVFFGLAGPLMADEPPYRLGDGDLVRVTAPAAQGVSGTYRLGENGQIAIPVDEAVNLNGLTLEEARVAIKAVLSRIVKQVSVGLELVERRPFFISGAVAQPGRYAHMSGLTLGEAMALAGGPYRLMGADALQTTITLVRSDEEFLGAQHDLAVAEVKSARIAAMLAGLDLIAAPETLDGFDPAQLRDILSREGEIMSTLNEAQANRLRLLNEQLVAKLAEVQTLEESIALAETRIAKVAAELTIAERDVANGIVTRDRLESLDRTVDQIRSEMLQTIVLRNQARGAQLDLALKVDELPRQWQVDLLRESADTQQIVAQMKRSLDAAAQLITATAGSETPRVKTVFAITRDGQIVTGIVNGSTAVLPGDLIEVTRATDLNGSKQ